MDGHRALMFPPETITSPGACVGLFFGLAGPARLSAVRLILLSRKAKAFVRLVRNEGFEQTGFWKRV
jgi:hypothetical protein